MAGVPRTLVLEARPVGRGARFQPPARGPVIGHCSGVLGPRFGVHLEVFAANRVVLIARGIGTKPPRRLSAGRIAGAHCYGELVTIDPTGLILVRRGAHLTVGAVFRSWGQPLSGRRIASFGARDQRVRVFVNGRASPRPPGQVPLARHAEIVLEIGPPIPPHAAYTFPPGT